MGRKAGRESKQLTVKRMGVADFMSAYLPGVRAYVS